MHRVKLLALMSLVAAGLFSLGLSTRAVGQRADDRKSGEHGHASHFMECAKACHECARECDACATHCADQVASGKKEHLKTLRACQDCATACTAAASITARKGPFSDLICKACEEACKRCAEACEQHKDDPVMKRCAEECRRCEKACQEMTRHAGKHQAK